jgi:hypothetical protein
MGVRMAVLGLDLGATKLAGGLFDAGGNIVARALTLLERRDGDQVGRLVVEQVCTLRDEAAARGWDVRAVAVAVPGIARPATGTVWAPNIGGWDDYPLRDLLLRALGGSCPVMVESDRAASILGEVARGAARGCRHAIFLAVGTGIGAGILADGALVRGAHDIAGAFNRAGGSNEPGSPGWGAAAARGAARRTAAGGMRGERPAPPAWALGPTHNHPSARKVRSSSASASALAYLGEGMTRRPA